MAQTNTIAESSQPRVYPASCEPCRKRKSRCNRLKPCANCDIRGIPDQCYLYSPRIQGRKVARDSSISTSSSVRPRKETNRGASELRSPASKANDSHVQTLSSAFILHDTEEASSLPKGHVSLGSTSTSHDHDAISQKDPSLSAENVRWENISEHLPSATLCHKFLLYFFDELMPNVSFVNKEAFMTLVEPLFRGSGSISKRQTSLLFWLLAYASLTAPSKHPLRSTFIDLNKSAHQWKKVAISFHKVNIDSESISFDDQLLDISLCAMEAMWGSTLRADHERNWQLSGIGIRKASALHLFSKSRPSWDTSQQQTEIDTIGLISIPHMIQKLLVMDRWIAFTDLRPLGIHPTDITRPLTSLHGGGNLRAGLEQLQIRFLEEARELMTPNATPKDFTSVIAFLHRIDAECETAISHYSRDHNVRLDPQHCVQAEVGKHASVLLGWLASSIFIGCCTATHFNDLGREPHGLRTLSFQWAQTLLALAPSINAVQVSGMYAMRLTRIANHLFYAIRVIFRVLSKTDVWCATKRPIYNDPVMFGSCTWIEALHGDHESRGNEVSSDDIYQLRQHFQASLELFENFSSAGCTSASQALILIERVLSSNEDLRNKLFHTQQTLPELEITTAESNTGSMEGTEMDAATTLKSLQAHANDTNSDSVPISHSTSDPFLDPMLWQMPEFDSEDFEGLLAAWPL